MIDKRTLLAVFLILLVLFCYNLYLSRIQPPVEEKEIPVVREKLPSQPTVVSEPPGEGEVQQHVETDILKLSAPTASARDVVVETDLIRAVISTRGASIVNWELKNYTDSENKPVQLVTPNNIRMCGISLFSHSKQLVDLSGAIFECSKNALILNKDNPHGELTFSVTFASGERVTERFEFQNDKYTVNIQLQFDGLSNSNLVNSYRINWAPGFKVIEKNAKDDLHYFGAASYSGGELITDKLDDFKDKDNRVHTGAIDWIAIRSKYFIASLISNQLPTKEVEITKLKDENLALNLEVAVTPQPAITHNMIAYIGPIDYTQLEKLNVELEKVVDLGHILIRPLSYIMLKFLITVHQVVPNYGLVIIIFSIFTKLLFWPLTHKSFKAMKELQKLHPEIAEIREKYKKDPKRMNKAMMELYRKHKINPASGCLPILPQLPVFFALFKVLSSTIELRGAEFVWWIQDLSQKDPYYLLPILMGISMLVQQKMTPTDPRQAYLMYMMPIIFTAFFLTFPAGLVLYWLVQNLLSIVQQYYVHRKVAVEPVK